METQRLFVTGMACSGCVESVARALLAIDGVKTADVSLSASTATIRFDEQLISIDELTQAVQRAGYDLSKEQATGAPQSSKCHCCN